MGKFKSESMRHCKKVFVRCPGSLIFKAFDDQCLSWMNRDHDVHTAEKCLDYVTSQLQPKLQSFSIDLIFGRPHQRFVISV